MLYGIGTRCVRAKAVRSLAGSPEVDEPYCHVVFETVQVEGASTCGDYFLMIIETPIDCVDEAPSEYRQYEVDDPVRPDRGGE